MPSGDGDPDAFGWRLLPLLVLTAFAIVAADLSDGTPYLADVDDTLRGIQIHQLLTSGHWFDLTLPMIRMPAAYLSPWSRLVDAPYGAISWCLSFFLDSDRAMRWSFLIWPPTILVGYVVLVFHIIRALPMPRLATNGAIAVMTVLFMVLAIEEFIPGRIDHHNMQIMLLMAMAAGVLRWTAGGGVVVGVATALSIAVGLECLPIIAVLIGGIVVAWLFGVIGAGTVLRWTMLSIAIATPIAALALIGVVGIVSTQCDAFSAPYIYIAGLAALGAFAATVVAGPQSSLLQKLSALLLPGVAVAIGFVWLFPACLAGPYGIIDPISRQFWFTRIQQENGALDFFRGGQHGMILLSATQAVTALLALPAIVAQMRRGRAQEAIVFFTAVAALFLSILLIRFVRFPAALVPLFVPMALARLLTLATAPDGMRLAWRSLVLACGPVLLVVSAAFLLTPVMAETVDSIDFMNVDDCRRDNLAALSQLAPGIVMAPPGLGLQIARHAVDGISVAAIPFHRASPGMKRVYQAFTSTDPAVRREAMAPFDYVAVCRVPFRLDNAAPLFSLLANSGGWPGLIPLDGDDPARPLRLFRIDHAQLQ